MIELELTHFARARIRFCRATPAFDAEQTMTRSVDGNPASSVKLEYLMLEAYVPRGGFAEYGLLGFHYLRGGGSLLQVDVPYTEGPCTRWLDSLAAHVDDVRLGLTHEFAAPIADAVTQLAARALPPGRIVVVEAAHGKVGSSERLFRRMATVALSLMRDGCDREPEQLAAFLRGSLVGP